MAEKSIQDNKLLFNLNIIIMILKYLFGKKKYQITYYFKRWLFGTSRYRIIYYPKSGLYYPQVDSLFLEKRDNVGKILTGSPKEVSLCYTSEREAIDCLNTYKMQ